MRETEAVSRSEESRRDTGNAPATAAAKRGSQEERQIPLATRFLPIELANYLRQFRSLFGRFETFENACNYLLGLLSELQRKNGETMAAAIEGIANNEAVHRFLALSPWSAKALDRLRVAHALKVASGQGEAMLIVDEVSQKKRGQQSVGVKRQYLGCAGKTENGQVAVTLHYCDDRYDWPVTGQIYLPKDWAEDKQRRERAGVPAEIPFMTKAAIAMQLVRKAISWGIPVRWICMDAGYDDLDVLVELNGLGLAFCVGVKSDFTIRVPDDMAQWVAPAPARRERPRKHVDPRCLPPLYRVDALRSALPESEWRAVTYREGTAGPLTKEFAAVRALCATKEKTGPEVWLLFERPVSGQSGDLKQYVLAPGRDLTLEELAQVAHRRPLIERFSYENGKGEVGLRDYQGRSWSGFHHHLAMAMLALTWLNLQRLPLPPGPADPPTPPQQSASSQPTRAISLPIGDRLLHFEAAEPTSRPIPIPRHLWESVQDVRRRFVAWCSIMVHRALARRRQPLRLPVFVPLC